MKYGTPKLILFHGKNSGFSLCFLLIDMEIVVDNRVVKLLALVDEKLLANPLISDADNEIGLRWPSLLECLGLGSLFLDLPVFEQGQALFEASVATLDLTDEKEVVFYMFDRLFTECLNQIKALRQINGSFLLSAIKDLSEKNPILSSALAPYRVALSEETSDTMHDLILYLAWDRMCVWVGNLFNHQSTNPKFVSGIETLKECLIESYMHITQNGKTAPGYYRMIEALFFYQMREENLQKPTVDEWTLLTQSFHALKAQDALADVFYIDDAVKLEAQATTEEEASTYLTLDSPETTGRRIALAQYMMSRLQEETPLWGYVLQSKNITYTQTT